MYYSWLNKRPVENKLMRITVSLGGLKLRTQKISHLIYIVRKQIPARSEVIVTHLKNLLSVYSETAYNVLIPG